MRIIPQFRLKATVAYELSEKYCQPVVRNIKNRRLTLKALSLPVSGSVRAAMTAASAQKEAIISLYK